MAFGSSTVFEADVAFRASYAQFEGDTAKIREAAERTYGAIDNSTLKASLASEKYDRALARSKGSAYAVQRATAAYKAELATLEATQGRATVASTRHSGALQQEERNLSHLVRGGIAGSGALERVGRAAIFASTSVLGGYGLVYAFRSVIGAAKEQEVALGHLQVALEDSGAGWERNKVRVEDALTSLVKATAFTKNDLTESLATTARRFGDVDQALNATSIAADVARAKNIDLATATNLVIRASLGQSKSAKALGVDVAASTTNIDQLRATTKNATAEQIKNAKAADLQASKTSYLDAIQQKYQGNAARYLQTSAGKQALFNAELQQSEEIVGQALLPTLNHYLGNLSVWLNKMNQSGRLQHDVNAAMKTGGDVVHDLEGGFKAISPVLSGFNHLVGGTRNEVRLLLALFAAWKFGVLQAGLRGLTGGIRGVGAAAATTAGELNTMTAAEGRAAAGGATGGVPTFGTTGPFSRAGQIPNKDLRAPSILGAGATLGGSFIGSIALSSFGAIPDTKNGIPMIGGGTFFGTPPAPGSRIKGKDGKTYIVYYSGGKVGFLDAATVGQANAAGNVTAGDSLNPRSTVPGSPSYLDPNAAAAAATKRVQPTLGGLSYQLQNALLEAQGTPGTADDMKSLNDELAYLNRALAQKQTPAARNALLQQRNDVLSQRDQITQAATAARKSAATAAAAKRKQRFTGQTVIPATLVKQLADAQRTGKPADTIVAIIRKEEQALRSQSGQLHREGAPESYEATIAKELKTLHDEIVKAISGARKQRIAKLDAVPAGLQLEEANAIANNASQERLLAIYKKEKQRLDEQLKTLVAMKATQAEKLKNRQAAAAIEKKILAAQKSAQTDFGAVEREFLSAQAGFFNDVASNVFTSGSGATVNVHQHFPHPPTADGHRESLYARRAASAAFDG
jgi:hypothetical protein